MRFMCIVKATTKTEAGIPAPRETLEAMHRSAEELVKAGVMLVSDGLHPSSKGARVRFDATGSKHTVIDGPFPETKELIAGFAILQVKSKEEAIEWVKRMPHPHPGQETEVEVRQVFEPSDFAELYMK
jgi:hypothetical protein